MEIRRSHGFVKGGVLWVRVDCKRCGNGGEEAKLEVGLRMQRRGFLSRRFLARKARFARAFYIHNYIQDLVHLLVLLLK